MKSRQIIRKHHMNLKRFCPFLLVVISLFIFQKEIVANCIPEPEPPPSEKNIKLALLLDTSNSMDGLIEQAKSQLWKIVNELATAKRDGLAPKLQIALYEYGNDGLSAKENYIRMVTPLTSSLDKISEDLFSLRTNGGSEFCGAVIQTATHQLDWSSATEDLQIIVIAGNEPFTQGTIHYQEACSKAKEKGIIINTIFCGDFNEGVRTYWKEGAQLTGGTYMSIEQNRKTVYIDSPYDKKLMGLNEQLNDTYLPYGQKGKSSRKKQLDQDKNTRTYGSANYVERAVSKSSHVYKNNSWDLVDAEEETSFDIANIKREELPKEMQNMNTKEKEAYITKKKNDRERIQKEIRELQEKRTQFISQKQKENSTENMLDEELLKAIKKQAQMKKFVFE